jgi:hypothetical protein
VDVLGLALAIAAVLVANCAYVLFVRFGIRRWPRLRPTAVWISRLVLLLAVADAILVAIAGAVAARTRIGPAYWTIHLVAVIAGAPALANVLLLRSGGYWLQRWVAVIVLCSLFGIALVFFQVSVGDALYGPDGVGGPFSAGAPPSLPGCSEGASG